MRIAPLLAVLACIALGSTRVAVAEPYLAVQQGYKCVACHVNPTGGGLRNTFGLVYAENVMPATTLPAGAPVWLGQVLPDIVRVGAELGVPFAATWSCYQGGAVQCGRCGTCVERQEAFELAGIADPTRYIDPDYWREACARSARATPWPSTCKFAGSGSPLGVTMAPLV